MNNSLRDLDLDIIVCFNSGKLSDKRDWGHISLVQGIENDIVSLVVPGKDLPKTRKVKKEKWRFLVVQ